MAHQIFEMKEISWRLRCHADMAKKADLYFNKALRYCKNCLSSTNAGKKLIGRLICLLDLIGLMSMT